MNIHTFTKGPEAIEKRQVETAPDFLKSGRTPRIGVLINPLSGGNRKGLGAIRDAIVAYPQVYHCDVQTPQDVLGALADFARKKVDLVAVNGGDGTVQAVLTVLFYYRPFQSLPMLALLRGGTANMLSNDLGLRGSQQKALRRLMAWAFAGEGDAVVRQRPVLKVQIAGGQKPLYGLFFGAGAIYNGIQFFHKKVKTWGLHSELAHILIVIRYLTALAVKNKNVASPVPITIGLDRNQLERREYLFVLISTLEQLILGMRPYWGVENGPLQFTAVNGRPQNLLRTFLRFAWNRKNRQPKPESGYLSHNVHEVRLNFDSGFTLDGQLYTPNTRKGFVVVQNGGTASFLRL